MLSDLPFATKKTIDVRGKKMSYIDEGQGDAIVFQHGNPTSSYLWRNIMPYCEGAGRLVACDLIGMGDSEKLSESDHTRYTYCLLYTSPSPRDVEESRMPSSA